MGSDQNDATNSRNRPSRSTSISNLKRSLSKSSSISSLKSILKSPFQINNDSSDEIVEYIKSGNGNGNQPLSTKRRKTRLLNELSSKRKKFFTLLKANNISSSETPSSSALTSSSTVLEQQKNRSKRLPQINNAHRKYRNDNSTTTISNPYPSISSRIMTAANRATAPGCSDNYQNLQNLDNKMYRKNRAGANTFRTINEENAEQYTSHIPPSSSCFEFNPDTDNQLINHNPKNLAHQTLQRAADDHSHKSLPTSTPNAFTSLLEQNKSSSLVTSKGYYNLSKIMNSSPTDFKQEEPAQDDQDATMVDSPSNSTFVKKSASSVPYSTAFANTSTPGGNSYMNDGDTLIEDDCSTSNILSDISTIQSQHEKVLDPESYLDYFKNTIEPIHNHQDKGTFVNQYYKKKDVTQQQQQPDVGHITKKLSMASIHDAKLPATLKASLAPKRPAPPLPSLSQSMISSKNRHRNKISIFELPEILERILSFVENDQILPVEKTPIRRKPLSFEHAKLIYKNEAVAKAVWNSSSNNEGDDKLNELILANYLKNEKEAGQSLDISNVTEKSNIQSGFYANNAINQSIKNLQNIKVINKSMYNCLFVNKLWHKIAEKIIFRKLFFNNDTTFQKLVSKIKNDGHNMAFKNNFKNASTNVLLLHKLKNVTQDQINMLSNYVIANGNKLEWIEMYICPTISPPISLFTSNNLSRTGPLLLKKLILAGSNSKKINNFFLKIVANNCPNLEKIDLRSCEYFTDDGLIEISKNCHKLSYLNIGRFKNCDKITDASVCFVIKNCENLKTLGCAGCFITDNTIWALANYQNHSIEKLSLNNCFRLTNNSIPIVFERNYLKNLLVLEIRNVTNISNFKPIIEFKKRKFSQGEIFLIENCEILEKRMMEQEFQMNLEISKRMLSDITVWCDDSNDGDVDFQSFIQQKQHEHAHAHSNNKRPIYQ